MKRVSPQPFWRVAVRLLALAPITLLAASLPAGNLPPVAAAAQVCNWSGTWAMEDSGKTMTLTQAGSQVTGTMPPDEFAGTVSGNTLTGRWTHGGDTGPFELTMASSCTRFTGTWGNSVNPRANPLNGTRSGGLAPTPTSRPPATTTLPPPPPPPPPPVTGTGELGGIDVDGYCRVLAYEDIVLFDGAQVYEDGIWYCVAFNPLGIGFDVATSVDDLGAVCQWQYSRPNAFAQQQAPGNPESWRCFAPAPTATVPVSVSGRSAPEQLGCIPCDGQARFLGFGNGVARGLGVGNAGEARIATAMAAGTLRNLQVTISAPDGGIWYFGVWVNGAPAALGCTIDGRASRGQAECADRTNAVTLNAGDRVSLGVGNPGDPFTHGAFFVEWSAEFSERR